MKILIFISIAMMTGGLLPVQAALNAQLGHFLKHPLLSTFINVFVGLLTVSVILLLARPEYPSFKTVQTIPPYLYLGGIIGAIFVTIGLLLLPKIGATNTMMAMVVGQLLVSIIIDHYGLLNAPVLELSGSRISGAIFLLFGLYLIQRTN